MDAQPTTQSHPGRMKPHFSIVGAVQRIPQQFLLGLLPPELIESSAPGTFPPWHGMRKLDEMGWGKWFLYTHMYIYTYIIYNQYAKKSNIYIRDVVWDGEDDCQTRFP